MPYIDGQYNVSLNGWEETLRELSPQSEGWL